MKIVLYNYIYIYIYIYGESSFLKTKSGTFNDIFVAEGEEVEDKMFNHSCKEKIKQSNLLIWWQQCNSDNNGDIQTLNMKQQ
jgi:hypothetical protein